MLSEAVLHVERCANHCPRIADDTLFLLLRSLAARCGAEPFGKRPMAESAPTRAAVVQFDVADGWPDLSEAGGSSTVLALVRLFSEPIGIIKIPAAAPECLNESLAAAVDMELGRLIEDRLVACGVEWHGLSRAPITPVAPPQFETGRQRATENGPAITAVIASRGRAAYLERTLASLRFQRYPRLSIIVVDNAPTDNSLRIVADRFDDELEIRYVVEPRPGLSFARNCGIAASGTEIVAFLDDDERCDTWWSTELARGFLDHPECDAVSGVILADELDTVAQRWFEEFGGHHKGRGFLPELFSPVTRELQSPLWPAPPFGSGGNMAFRRNAIERIGRFDCALGAGTASRAAEDTAVFATLLWEGGSILYQPSAIVWHRHYREVDDLRRQLIGYGRGLGAFYTSMVARHPACIVELARLAVRARRYQFASESPKIAGLGADFPADLLRANRLSVLTGPFAYIGARMNARRLSRMTWSAP